MRLDSEEPESRQMRDFQYKNHCILSYVSNWLLLDYVVKYILQNCIESVETLKI